MYVPVDPQTKIVHRYAQPKIYSNEKTVCNRLIPWVRSFSFIKNTDLMCTDCWENN